MTMEHQKRSLGIDISKDTFTACICTKMPDNTLNFSDVSSFPNSRTGFNQLVKWARKDSKNLQGVNFLMEATGVYHESLAFHLDRLGMEINVVLPNTSRHYSMSLNIKTKTDSVDARVLSQFAIERRHNRWHAPKSIYMEIRNLTRFLLQLQGQKTAFGNLQHAKESAEQTQGFILDLNKRTIEHIELQIQKVRKEIERVCRKDNDLWAKVSNILTIKGVGIITAATIVAETMGFEKVKSAKQLASYAGYDVIQRESGTSVKGRTRISKKGNSYIRHALYFPAIVACMHNQQMKEDYTRITKRKESKMVGQVAIQRRILLLMYTLWKNDATYDPMHKSKVAPTKNAEATQDSDCVAS